MNRIVSIDLGSSNLKMTLFSEEGAVLRELRRPTPLHRQDGVRVEIEPEEVVDVLKDLFAEMAGGAADFAATLAAVTVTGMAKSELPLDRTGKILAPCITWMDRRCQGMERRSYAPIAARLQHYPVISNCLPFKLEWMRREEPETYRRSYKWVNIVDYIQMRLSGNTRAVTDYTEACRSMVYDSPRERWDEAVADFFDIDLALMPEVEPSSTILGTIAPEFVTDCEAFVVLGGHDHMCAAKAACMDRLGSPPLLSTGTSEILALPYEGGMPDELPGCNLDHQTDPGRLALVGCVARSGETMRWADGLFGLYEQAQDPALADRLLGDPENIPLFVPPYRYSDTGRGGGFSQLAGTTGKAELSLSVLEGISHASSLLCEDMERAAGEAAEQISLVGGFTGIHELLRLKAAAFDKTLAVYPNLDMASLGGFLICVQALQPQLDMRTFCRQTLSAQEHFIVEPDERLAAAMQSRRERYRRLAANLEEVSA